MILNNLLFILNLFFVIGKYDENQRPFTVTFAVIDGWGRLVP